MTYERPSSPTEMLAFLSTVGPLSFGILESFVGLIIRRNAGCDSLGLGFLEYLDFLPGMEGLEGNEGVPMDLNVSLVVVVSVAES